MNYGKNGIKKDIKKFDSPKNKTKTRTGVRIFKCVLLTLFLICIIGGSALFGMIRSIINNAPDIEDVDVTPSGAATTVYDAEGNVIETLVKSGSNREPVNFDELPDDLINAFVAIEDSRFWTHNGIDLKGILRAAVVGITSGDFTEGASTITQQLLKNSVFDGGMEKGLGARLERKIQEQYLALQLEKTMDKEEILTNYLNTINLGSNTLGVQSASQRYFNKDVSDLTLSECATLAAITNNPTKYNPITNPEENNKRRQKVLEDMYEQGYIDEGQKEAAVADNVYERIQSINASDGDESSYYSYFVDSLIRSAIQDLVEKKGYSESEATNLIYSGGLKIHSTMDSRIQAIVDEEISNPDNYPASVTEYSFTCSYTVTHPDGTTDTYTASDVRTYYRTTKNAPAFKLIFSTMDELNACLEEFKSYITGEGDVLTENYLDITLQPQASFVVMDQSTGQVKAIAGGRGEKTGNLSLNRATQSTRQPGSTFKVLAALAPAIDAQGATLATTYYDEPYTLGDKTFKNHWGDFYVGYANLRQCCIFSMNIIATKCLMNTVTPQLGYDYLLKFGFSTLVDNYQDEEGNSYTDIGSSLALGGITKGVTNLELTAAYAAIANKGVYTEPVYYTRITASDGTILLDNSTPETHTVIKESTAFLLTSAMEQTMEPCDFPGRAGAFGSGGMLAKPNNITTAGKSGTTTSNNDVWFVGFSPYYTAGVWSGYDENKEINLSAAYHKRIWQSIMTRIHEGMTDMPFEVPEGIETATICSKSGKLAVEGVCDQDPRGGMVYTEYFAEGTAPTDYCDVHVAVTLCGESGLPVSEYCPESQRTKEIYLIVPEGSSTNTDDAQFALPDGFMDQTCTIHGINSYLPSQQSSEGENGGNTADGNEQSD